MLRTIVLGSCVSVQGQFVRQYSDGRVAVQVGSRIYIGYPVEHAQAA